MLLLAIFAIWTSVDRMTFFTVLSTATLPFLFILRQNPLTIRWLSGMVVVRCSLSTEFHKFLCNLSGPFARQLCCAQSTILSIVSPPSRAALADEMARPDRVAGARVDECGPAGKAKTALIARSHLHNNL